MELPMDPLTHHGQAAQPATTAFPVSAVPDEAPVPMPVQDFAHWAPAQRVWPEHASRTARWRRTLVLTMTLFLTAVASYEMYRVLSVHSMTALQVALLVVFTITFVWIALPFVCGLAGVIALWRAHSVSGLALPPSPCTPT